MRIVCGSIITALAFAGAAAATELPVPHGPPPPSQVVHNGSLMDVVPMGGGHVVIRYAAPAPWMAGLVAPGTVLVDGVWSRGYLNATAFVFTYCGAFPYAVGGSIDQGGALVLTGPSPIIFDDCFVGGYTWESGNAHLVFNRSHGDGK
jgi:hypothetical protein